MLFQKYKKWIIIGLVIIAAFILYTILSPKGGEDELLTSTSRQTPAEIVGVEIIAALNQIESLKLDRSIFDNPVYQSLKDRSQEIPPEPVGKPNPFDPIGSSLPDQDSLDIEDVETDGDGNQTSNRGPGNITNDSFISPPVI